MSQYNRKSERFSVANKVEQELERFFDHYKDYKRASIQNKYRSCADDRFSFSLNCELIIYRRQVKDTKQSDSNNVFLIIPSIFNSPEILFINSKLSFVEYLKSLADVYLLDWSNIIAENFSLEHYVHEVTSALKYLHNKGMRVRLIGHCIGGTIALAAAILQSPLVKNLTLLTTPWDFSHFAPALKAYKQLDIAPPQMNIPFIPKIYIKILFFLLAPDYLSAKVSKYFNIESEKDRNLFLEVESWLFSGNQITNITYSQITNELAAKNILVNERWQIKDKIINPKFFDKPVFILGALEDKLVPILSMTYLKNSLKNSTFFEAKGGHINYLIGNKISDFIKSYENWLK